MTRKIFITISLIYSIIGYSQNMKPNNSLFDLPNYSYKYYSKVKDNLIKDYYKNTIFQYVVLPSFTPEYVFRIIKSKDEYYAVVTKGNKNIWYLKNDEDIEVTTTLSLMKENDVNLLLNVLNQTLSKIEYNDQVNLTVDGTKYFFYITKNNLSGTVRTGDKFSDYYIITILNELAEKALINDEIELNDDHIKLLNSKSVVE